MKTLLFSYKFLFVTLMSLPLALCSSDNENETETPFQPIEITFTEDFFTDCNQVKTISGAKVSYRPTSQNENCGNGDVVEGLCGVNENLIQLVVRDGHTFKGEYGIFLGNHLEVDLSDLNGASKVILTVEDYCSIGCTSANLYKNGQVVSTISNKAVNEVENLVFDIDEANEKITVYSCEGYIYKITIE